jgi:hypothetical protein
MTKYQLAWLAMGTLAALPFACIVHEADDETDEVAQVCVPGDTQLCHGLGACEGAQLCNLAGTASGACDCGIGGAGGAAGAGGAVGGSGGAGGGNG